MIDFKTGTKENLKVLSLKDQQNGNVSLVMNGTTIAEFDYTDSTFKVFKKVIEARGIEVENTCWTDVIKDKEA